MSANVLLLSHGELAKSMCESLKMLVGDVGKFEYVCLDNDGVDKFRNSFRLKIDNIDNDKEIYILCDIKGGTPFNEAFKYKLENKADFRILTGMNIPMLLDIYFNLDNLNSEQIILNSKESIEIIWSFL